MGSIKVQTEQSPRGLVIKVTGDAGVDNAEELDRQLNGLTGLKPKLAVLDLSGVAFISSTAMESLLRFRNEVAASGGSVALAALQPNVRDAFKFAGLGKVFAIHGSVEEAMKEATP